MLHKHRLLRTLAGIVVPCMLLSLAPTMPALADDGGALGAGVQFGTLGIGPSLTYHINDQLDAHVVNGSYGFNANVSTNSATYQGTINLGGTAGWLDFAPGGGFLRISVGALANNLSVKATATPANATYTFNGNTYAAANLGNVDGSITWPGIAPYLGLSFAQSHFHPHAGLVVFGSAGVALVSAPDVSLTPSDPAAFTTYPQLQSDLAAEKSSIASQLSVLRTYPVATFGLQYRF